jgi:hypothetical protein
MHIDETLIDEIGAAVVRTLALQHRPDVFLAGEIIRAVVETLELYGATKTPRDKIRAALVGKLALHEEPNVALAGRILDAVVGTIELHGLKRSR